MLQGSVLLLVGLPAVAGWATVRWIRDPDRRPETVMRALFAAYLVVVASVTMFPIAVDGGRVPGEMNVNLIPFRGLFAAGDISRPQALPNVLLGVPFGFLAPFVLRRPTPVRVLGAGAAVFVGVEVLQLVIVTVFPGSPRTADVTDVILNVLGVAVGIGLFAFVARWIRGMAADGVLSDDGGIARYVANVAERADGV